MTEVFCDILPHARGWVFISGGVRSPSYPSYHLAVEAARRHLDDVGGGNASTVLRQQDLKGRMLKITALAASYQPTGLRGVGDSR